MMELVGTARKGNNDDRAEQFSSHLCSTGYEGEISELSRAKPCEAWTKPGINSTLVLETYGKFVIRE
jgi:hypothetical protein